VLGKPDAYAFSMAIIATRPADEERLSVPWNIAEWADAKTIRAWVCEEIDALDWSSAELAKFLRDNPNFRPRVLLTILSYAYSTGNYESEEISHLCASDPELRAMCGQNLPSSRALDRFRRENRGLLKWVLVQILKRALRAQYGLNPSVMPAGLKQHLIQLATERLDMARHMDRAGQGA
jgi:hypothetical protein